MSNEDNWIYTPDEMREVFTNFIKEAVNDKYFQVLFQLTRKAAECARNDTEVREILTRKLDMSVKCYPELERSANIFRALYLDGSEKPTYKQVGEQFYMDKSNIPRHINKVLRILVVMLFAVAGIEWESEEPSETPA